MLEDRMIEKFRGILVENMLMERLRERYDTKIYNQILNINNHLICSEKDEKKVFKG